MDFAVYRYDSLLSPIRFILGFMRLCICAAAIFFLLIRGNNISGLIARAYVKDRDLAMRALQREMPRLMHSDRCTGKKIPA
jgi:hypothetical protein